MPDPVADLLTTLVEPAPAALGRLLAAAWRAAVLAVAEGTSVDQARHALRALRVVTPA
jgi:hypothetical protein